MVLETQDIRDDSGQKTSNYLVLSRKYRPQFLYEIIGQEVFVKTISNAFPDRVAHAYLFSGIRGVGKTTAARILARLINCSDLKKNDSGIIVSCNTCDNCIAYNENAHPDFIELDAASKTSVTDIRELLDTIRYMPLLGKYKICILDEVHMLSSSAFAALLKTLEEPESHIKFLFATTELKKLPLTVLSRCQRFDLKRVEPSAISALLSRILMQEKILCEEKARDLIARKADGSVRDALSLLDSAINFASTHRKFSDSSTNTIKYDDIKTLFGSLDDEMIQTLLLYILQSDIENLLQYFHKIYIDGIALPSLIEQLIYECYKLMLRAAAKEAVVANGAQISISALLGILEQLNIINKELKLAFDQKTVFEIGLVKLCYVAHLPSADALLQQAHQKLQIPQSGDPKKTKIVLQSFLDVVELFKSNAELVIAYHLSEHAKPLEFRHLHIKIAVTEAAPRSIGNDISRHLKQWTGENWCVILDSANSFGDSGAKTIAEINAGLDQEKIEGALAHDAARDILSEFGQPDSVCLVKGGNLK